MPFTSHLHPNFRSHLLLNVVSYYFARIWKCWSNLYLRTHLHGRLTSIFLIWLFINLQRPGLNVEVYGCCMDPVLADFVAGTLGGCAGVIVGYVRKHWFTVLSDKEWILSEKHTRLIWTANDTVQSQLFNRNTHARCIIAYGVTVVT